MTRLFGPHFEGDALVSGAAVIRQGVLTPLASFVSGALHPWENLHRFGN